MDNLENKKTLYRNLLLNGGKKTRLDRLKEYVLELSPKELSEFDDWSIDRRMVEEDELDSKASIVSSSNFIESAKERNRNWNKLLGLSSGYWVIDGMTMGLAPGELTIVAGETSQGKTLFCVNVAANILKEGHKVVFLTLEMTKEELTSRFLNIMGEDEFVKVADNLMFQKEEKLSWMSVPRIMKKAVDAGAEIVFIDHLHYFSRDFKSTAEELGAVTQEFKQSAIRYGIPVVLISHTRKIEKGKKHADISDLRGSSYIAQDSDIVLMVWQDKEMPDTICIELSKNRNRLKYRVGTNIHFQKSGLKIVDVPKEKNIVEFLDEQDVTKKSKFI